MSGNGDEPCFQRSASTNSAGSSDGKLQEAPFFNQANMWGLLRPAPYLGTSWKAQHPPMVACQLLIQFDVLTCSAGGLCCVQLA
eukprot:scaffold141471_cov12-Tisochrysis_lutea.AAC.1